ncbi:hypothetical protein AB0D33_01465 [Streptomyces sp. NPDC048404]|uniref:hypothetical protein n=1 Tax=unclassified Streptomyces TaxID=2593676 RepID=UPI00343E9453
MSAATPLPVPDEDHSTGAAWRAPHAEPAVVAPSLATPCTPEEQAEHLATLAEAICGFRVGVALKASTARDAA